MTIEELAALLENAGSAHHEAFIETDGDDPEWAMWYADYIRPQFEAGLGRKLTTAEIAEALTRLDANYRANQSGDSWAVYYARHMLDLWH